MKTTAKSVYVLSLRVCAGLTMAAMLAVTALAQVQNFGDISVRVEALHSAGVGWGYIEHRATLINNSRTKSHQVTLLLTSGSEDSYEVGSRELLRRIIELAPGVTATASLYGHATSGVLRISIDGQMQDPDVEVSNERVGNLNIHSSDGFGLLLSQKVFKSGLGSSVNFEQGSKDTSGESLASTQTYQASISDWSTGWMTYARFHGVIVSGEELNAVSESVRTALLRYVERGGSLMVIGYWQVPPQWRTRQGAIKDEEVTWPASGSGKLPVPVPSPAPKPSKLQKDLPVFYLGFGNVIVTGDIDPAQITVNQWRRLGLNFEATRPRLTQYNSLTEINDKFQVVERLGVPVRGLFALILLFVIVIGPVNLIWLARRKRKIWMLWTVPVISFMTCLAVAGSALFGEGWNATTRIEALTILDEASHRAATIGWIAFYSPITPNDGLHFSYDTEVYPQLPGKVLYTRRTLPEQIIDWTSDQHLASGYVSARIPAFFRFRKSELRRERLSLRPSAGGLAVVNGLGGEIKQLWLADRDGRILNASNIAAGSQSELMRTSLQTTGEAGKLREVLSVDAWLSHFRLIEQTPQQYLMPNSYLAIIEASPFVEEGLKNAKTRRARTIVYGLSTEVEQ